MTFDILSKDKQGEIKLVCIFRIYCFLNALSIRDKFKNNSEIFYVEKQISSGKETT